MLNMCDLFEDDYKEFVLGELTELWDTMTHINVPYTIKVDLETICCYTFSN